MRSSFRSRSSSASPVRARTPPPPPALVTPTSTPRASGGTDDLSVFAPPLWRPRYWWCWCWCWCKPQGRRWRRAQGPPPPQPGERQLPKCPNGTSDTGYSNISNGSGNNNNSHSAGDIGGGLLGVSPAWADDHSDDERSSSGRSNSTSPVDFGLVGASKVSAANKNVVVGAAVSHCTNDDGGGRFHQNPRATPRHRRTGRHVGREWRSSTSSAPIPTAVTRTIG